MIRRCVEQQALSTAFAACLSMYCQSWPHQLRKEGMAVKKRDATTLSVAVHDRNKTTLPRTMMTVRRV
jgi:organic hydroperoxide reductase OsmC/OhrA